MSRPVPRRGRIRRSGGLPRCARRRGHPDRQDPGDRGTAHPAGDGGRRGGSATLRRRRVPAPGRRAWLRRAAPLRRHRRRLRVGHLAQRRLRMARALPRARVPGGTRRILLDAGLCPRGAGPAPAGSRGRRISRSRPTRGPCCRRGPATVPIEEAIARELLWVQRELA